MKKRQQQVANTLRKALSEIIQTRFDLSAFGLLTITDAVVSTKLENIVFYVRSTLHPQKAVEKLTKLKPDIIRLLQKAVNIRKLPQISFQVDIRPDQAERIEKLLELHQKNE